MHQEDASCHRIGDTEVRKTNNHHANLQIRLCLAGLARGFPQTEEQQMMAVNGDRERRISYFYKWRCRLSRIGLMNCGWQEVGIASLLCLFLTMDGLCGFIL